MFLTAVPVPSPDVCACVRACVRACERESTKRESFGGESYFPSFKFTPSPPSLLPEYMGMDRVGVLEL